MVVCDTLDMTAIDTATSCVSGSVEIELGAVSIAVIPEVSQTDIRATKSERSTFVTLTISVN